MGLDTTHDCWHGSYGSFSMWRNTLAKLAGYFVHPVQWPNCTVSTPLLEWSKFTQDNVYGKWETTPEDPLIVLLCHSDCDGVINPRDAGPLADRLEELLRVYREGESVEPDDTVWNFEQRTQQFVNGLRRCVEENEPVEFY